MTIGSSHKLSHINYIPNINIQGHSIDRADQFEQLGVTIDDQLKWDKHVDKLCKKLSSALFSIRQVKFLPKSPIQEPCGIQIKILQCHLGQLWHLT